MNIVNATWEKRNLGVDCVEFEISDNDDIEEVTSLILTAQEEYQIAKVPVGDVRKQLAVQDCGFRFYETNLQLERKIKSQHNLPQIYSRFEKDVEYRDATKNEIDEILRIVEEGRMFTTDKVAQDPYFSPELSGRRYALWARDILNKSAKTVIGFFRGEMASFTIYEVKDKYYNAFIGGMFEKYRDKGLGFIPLYVTAEQIFDLGGGILKTGVSSNNPSILRLQLLFGCRITDMTNIYIKHL